MVILADHCVSGDIVSAMRRHGFSVERCIDIGLAGASDDEIFHHAKDADKVLLSSDKDFGNIVHFDIPGTAGVVIVRYGSIPRMLLAKVVTEFFTAMDEKILRGKLFVLDGGGVRVWSKRCS